MPMTQIMIAIWVTSFQFILVKKKGLSFLRSKPMILMHFAILELLIICEGFTSMKHVNTMYGMSNDDGS